VKDGLEMTKTHAPPTTYHAKFEMDPSGQWLVELVEIPQVHTFARTLGKAREYVIDALALWLNLPAEKVKDRIEFGPPVLPDHVLRTVQRALVEREIAEAVSKVAGDLLTDASIALVDDAHLSMRDAAEVLGMSHQRVQQLVASPHPRAPGRQRSSSEAAEDVARSLKEYLPGGSQELDAVAGTVALGLAIAWLETRPQ
jgi:predicted RNase H-like HicB family nuclease